MQLKDLPKDKSVIIRLPRLSQNLVLSVWQAIGIGFGDYKVGDPCEIAEITCRIKDLPKVKALLTKCPRLEF